MVFSDETAVQFLRQNHIDHSERYSRSFPDANYRQRAFSLLKSPLCIATSMCECTNTQHTKPILFTFHYEFSFKAVSLDWPYFRAGSKSNCQRTVQRTFIVCHETTTRWLGHWQSQAQADPQTRPARPESFTIRTKTNAKTNAIIHPSWPARRKLKSQHFANGFPINFVGARFSRNGFDIVFTFKSRKQENLFSRANLTVNLISSLLASSSTASKKLLRLRKCYSYKFPTMLKCTF